MTRVALLRYPGTWSERDFAHAFSLVPDVETEIVWHDDAHDLRGFDAAIVPGGFSYGDHLRAGAIAKISPATKALRHFAEDGGAVLGSCNGFQILCEAGLLPGALLRNASIEYRCEWIHVRVERGAATLEANPNGSIANIAGVCNAAGNVVGLMPHPERCVEALLGGTDGYRMLVNLAGARHGTSPALYR